ncbi:MAG: cytochrome C [Albidovulum sp.]
MQLRCLAAIIAMSLTSPALAAGDAALGESNFKKCKACHSIIADDGSVIYKGGKTGPNLYGVMDRAAASTDFNYSDLMKEAAATGLVWDEAAFVGYLADPSAFLKDRVTDSSGRSKMVFKLDKGGEDIAAFLASVVQ